MKLTILVAMGLVVGALSGCAAFYDNACCPTATSPSFVTTYTTYPACGACTTTYYKVDY